MIFYLVEDITEPYFFPSYILGWSQILTMLENNLMTILAYDKVHMKNFEDQKSNKLNFE